MFSVSDNGAGISEEDYVKIFERFYQVENIGQYGGTGIGLALSQGIVKAHQGDITVESQLGKGSCFKVTLKKGDAHFDSSVARVEPEQDKEYIYYSEDKELLVKEVQSAQSENGTTDCKLLVIDDNEEIRNILVDIFSPLYTVETASDGKEGYEKVKVMQPDLVISDIMMPGMDGFELCRRSKAELLTCHIPFLLLTAKGDEENRAEGYSAGADGYIAKPFSIKTLRTRVNSLIEQRIKLRERYRQKLLTDPSEIQIESENDKFIDTLVKAIEQNIDNSEFGIQELCEISRYSYQQVYRKVKALTGESINEFIRTVRLKRAAQYLAQSDTRISEIMYSVGFNSHSYFTKCFREHFGLSPKEYAEKHRRK